MSLYGYLSLALDIGILPRRSWSREDFLSLRGIPLRSTRRDREADSEAHCLKEKLPAVAGPSIPPWDSRLLGDRAA